MSKYIHKTTGAVRAYLRARNRLAGQSRSARKLEKLAEARETRLARIRAAKAAKAVA